LVQVHLLLSNLEGTKVCRLVFLEESSLELRRFRWQRMAQYDPRTEPFLPIKGFSPKVGATTLPKTGGRVLVDACGRASQIPARKKSLGAWSKRSEIAHRVAVAIPCLWLKKGGKHSSLSFGAYSTHQTCLPGCLSRRAARAGRGA